MTQNKLIAFCYLFIIGIGISMALPVNADFVFPFWSATGCALLVTVIAFAIVRKLRPNREHEQDFVDRTFHFDGAQLILWVLLLGTGLLLGYTRYLAMMQSPDRYVGSFTVRDGGALWHLDNQMTQTSFLKLKPLSTVKEDVRLRVTGQLEALQPVLDVKGDPILGADGRWQFKQINVPQHSQEILIPADTRAKTEFLVDQAFTRVESVEILNHNPADISIGIYQPQNIVELFARTGRNTVPVNMLGRITADPWVYSFKNILSITPDYIQFVPDGPYLPVDRQTVRVTLEPDIPGYDALARSAAYGYDVAIHGELLAPSGAANIGTFDQAKYLRNHNVGGQTKLRATPDYPNPISVIIPQGKTAPRDGNGLVEFSLYLRDEIVRVIKQTMPQPNSAFLGALTLGLRYGMQNTISVAAATHSQGPVAPIIDVGENTTTLIADEFRASGINHVLAVSGLHVTIITIMFMGIFTMLRISRKVYVPMVIFALIIFGIITGARPSTLRAVIMNSLFLLTWGYLEQGLRSSALLGVPVAAFIILLQNPAMAVDPSFTLSFGAILSLALLTQPFFDILKKFKGNNFIVLVILLTVLTWAFAAHWLLVCTWRFWIGYTLLAVFLMALSNFLKQIGFNPLRNWGFADIPPGISTFLAAQFGIQVGMMIPLSAYYFFRWPVAGAYANLIAIPLVGVVLQLSMLAGLIGLIPGIGIYLALLLNAANWIFSTLFLLIGHYFARWFVYPFVTRPTLRWMLIYYIICALFVWWRPIFFRFIRPRWQRANGAQRLTAAIALILLCLCMGFLNHREKETLRHAGQLDITVFSVGYGSAILVDTPDNQAILIDTGFVQTDRGMRNEAERSVMPYLATHQINKLAGLILTCPEAEHTAGAATILEQFKIDTLYYPQSVQPVLEKNPLNKLLAERNPNRPKHRLSGTTIATQTLKKGDTLFQNEYDGKPFRIEVLSPDPEVDANTPLVLRLVYGDFAMLMSSDMSFSQQTELLRTIPAEQLKSVVMTLPHHGTTGLETIAAAIPYNYSRQLENATIALLKAANPEVTILEFGNPRPVVGEKSKVAIKLQSTTKRAIEDALPDVRHLATDTDGAIGIQTDGTEWSILSLSEMREGLDTQTDSPTSLEVGW